MAAVKKVLALYTSDWECCIYKSLFDEIRENKEFNYEFLFVTSDSESVLDLLQFTKKCSLMVTTHHIDIVLSANDSSALVHAALADTFKHIKGPSVESTFLTYHKYYTKMVLDQDPMSYKYGIIQANSPRKTIFDVAEVVRGQNGVFMKPTTSWFGEGIACSDSIEDLQLSVQQLSLLPKSKVDLGFLQKYINVKSYPYAVHDTIMLEECIRFDRQIQAECVVQNGKIIHWATVNWLHYTHKTNKHCCIGGITPADLSSEELERLWKCTDAIVSKMIDYGFNNQFVHCEFFMVDGDFKLIEVNGRIDPVMPAAYASVHEHGDSWKTLLHLGSGKDVIAPKHKGMLGMCGFIQTFASDIAENLLDFKEVGKHEEITPMCLPSDIIKQTSDINATVIAMTHLTGHSIKDLKRKHHDFCRLVLKNPDMSPWD